jgi:hypothetical protein
MVIGRKVKYSSSPGGTGVPGGPGGVAVGLGAATTCTLRANSDVLPEALVLVAVKMWPMFTPLTAIEKLPA